MYGSCMQRSKWGNGLRHPWHEDIQRGKIIKITFHQNAVVDASLYCMTTYTYCMDLP